MHNRKAFVLALFIAGGLGLFTSTAVYANAFFVSTDRVAYTGSVTTYATLSDAQNETNSIGTYAIPDRATSTPYNTQYRDLSVFVSNNAPSYSSDINMLLTSWYYTANPDHGFGWGNPNNTNTGFFQLYDDDGSTDTLTKGTFGAFDGTHYTEFRLQMTGENAGSAGTARLWPAPENGGASSISGGTFLNYALDITFGGLQGEFTDPATIVADDHPTSVNGSLNAIFKNTGTSADHNGVFYAVDFSFGMDNWAYGHRDELTKYPFSPSYFAEIKSVPEPSSLTLLGLASVLVLLMLRSRRNKFGSIV